MESSSKLIATKDEEEKEEEDQSERGYEDHQRRVGRRGVIGVLYAVDLQPPPSIARCRRQDVDGSIARIRVLVFGRAPARSGRFIPVA